MRTLHLGTALQRYLAELLGTFFLVLAGVGTVVIGRFTGVIGPVGMSGIFGVALLMVVCSIGRVSGAHVNPAVTIAFAISRDLPWRHVPGYVIAQAIGGIAGAGVVGLLFGQAVQVANTVPFPGALPEAFLAEMVFGFVLMFVAQSVSMGGRLVGATAGLAAGAALMVGVLVASPLSGGSLNPARSLGTALVSWGWHGHWIYWLAPTLGAILGSLMRKVIRPGAVFRRLRLRPAVVERAEPGVIVPTEAPSPA